MPSSSLAPILRVDRLSYCYPGSHPALRDVSFELGLNESIGLVGPNGAGKTTLLLHLNGLLPGELGAAAPRRQSAADRRDSGGSVITSDVARGATIEVLGMPVTAATLPEVRRVVGFLFQNPDDQLFCSTVLDDVAFGPLNLGFPADEVRRRVANCLAAVGLAGLEGRGTHELSFGERRRVCLAGVLACEPSLLALDEPSSNLDPRARRGFIEVLRQCPAAKIIASHDLELVLELCTRVVVLDQGRLQADGNAHDVLSDDTLMQSHGLEVPLSIRYGQRLAEPGK